MAPAILYEYLTEYHSSVLIKLDRGGQQSERVPQILFGFGGVSLQNNKGWLHQEITMKAVSWGKFGDVLI